MAAEQIFQRPTGRRNGEPHAVTMIERLLLPGGMSSAFSPVLDRRPDQRHELDGIADTLDPSFAAVVTDGDSAIAWKSSTKPVFCSHIGDTHIEGVCPGNVYYQPPSLVSHGSAKRTERVAGSTESLFEVFTNHTIDAVRSAIRVGEVGELCDSRSPGMWRDGWILKTGRESQIEIQERSHRDG